MSAPAEIRELEVQNPATSLLIARRLPPFLVEMTKPLFGDSLLELHELKRERRIFTTITSFILQCGPAWGLDWPFVPRRGWSSLGTDRRCG
jgi:hypothetical protein